MPWVIAYDGQDPLEYARAVAGMGSEESTGDAKPVQFLISSRAHSPFSDSFSSLKPIAQPPQSNFP